MSESDLLLICQILTEGTFEPIIICDDFMPLDCNDRVAKLFGFKSKYELLSQPIRKIIEAHFTPSITTTKEGLIRPAEIPELIFAKVVNPGSLKQTANVKTKNWSLNGKRFYSIAIKDIPIIKLASSKDKNQRSSQPCTANVPFTRTFVDSEFEPHIQSRLLNQFSQMANALPSLVWIVTQSGEVLYAFLF